MKEVDQRLIKILDGTQEHIAPQLPKLGPVELARIEELEADGKGRIGVLNDINSIIATQSGTASEEAPASASLSVTNPTANPSAKAKRGEEQPDWQKADYGGGLSLQQAEWRMKHKVVE